MVKVPPHLSMYDPVEGCFGIKNEGYILWLGCRDELQAISEVVSGFYYYEKPSVLSPIKGFIKKIEEVLELPPHKCIKFRKTDNPRVIYLSLRKWWRSPHRFSLLTLFMRLGYRYNGKDWKRVITRRHSYSSRNSNYAILWFLQGHTKLVHDIELDFEGWVDYFYYLSRKEIRKSLVRSDP